MSNELIDKVYVIRRKLNAHVIPKINVLAHSGLLIKSKNNNYYILEYGTTHINNNVSLRKVSFSNFSKDKFTELTKESYIWSKQIYGNKINNNITINQAKDIMDVYGNQKDYSLLKHNCHMAQEFTRSNLGIDVNKPYDIKNVHNIVVDINSLEKQNIQYFNDYELKEYNNDYELKEYNNDYELKEYNNDLFNSYDKLNNEDKLNENNDVLEKKKEIKIENNNELNKIIIPINLQQLELIDEIINEPINFVIDNVIEPLFDDLFIDYDLLKILIHKNKIRNIESLLLKKYLGYDILNINNLFKHHGNHLEKAIVIFDILNISNPLISTLKGFKIIKNLYKKFTTHNRKVKYHNIDFLLKWKSHFSLKHGYSNTTYIDNDYLNIHIKEKLKGHARYSRELAESKINDELMFHIGIPKDCLDMDLNKYKLLIKKIKYVKYEELFRKELLKYYLDHNKIKLDEYNYYLINSFDKDINKKIILNETDKNNIRIIYEKLHNDLLKSKHNLSNIKIFIETLTLNFGDILFLIKTMNNILESFKYKNKNMFEYRLIKLVLIPLKLKIINKLLTNSLNLFCNMSILKINYITSIIPIVSSMCFNTYELLNNNINFENYIGDISTNMISTISSINLSNYLSKILVLKAGIKLKISLLTGTIIGNTISSSVKTSIIIKFGIITITIGASTLKALGIGLIIMGLGLMIISIEQLILYIIKKNKIKDIKSFFMNENIFDYLNENIYTTKLNNIYSNKLNNNIFDKINENIYDNKSNNIFNNLNENIYDKPLLNIPNKQLNNTYNSNYQNNLYIDKNLYKDDNLYQKDDLYKENKIYEKNLYQEDNLYKENNLYVDDLYEEENNLYKENNIYEDKSYEEFDLFN